MRSSFIKLKFTAGSNYGEVIPRFSVEEVRMMIEKHPFNVTIMGPLKESLLKINEVADFFEYHFYGQLLAWEYFPSDSCTAGEMISFLQIETGGTDC